MAGAHELTRPASVRARPASGSAAWVFSLPLVTGLYVYLFALYHAKKMLLDGDTLWHIAAGRLILQNGATLTQDPFSHTVRGAPWINAEWLSEVVLALVQQAGGFTAVVAVTAAAFACTIALLTRALLRWLEPIHALAFAALGLLMTANHMLARPFMLAMPVMMIWTIALVRAAEENRSPRLWVLPLMTLWANLHGGFTLGLVLAFAFALEAMLAAWRQQRLAAAARSWGLFLVLAVAFALVTPHGTHGLSFTWQVLFEDSYALERIGEWRSPNFHILQPLELWLLGGLALVLHQGLRLPPVRLLLLLALVHLALKHVRNVELLGLIAPLVVAPPFAAQWREWKQSKPQLESADRFFAMLAQPAGRGAIVAGLVIVLGVPALMARVRPIELPQTAAPAAAIRAVQDAGIKGPVLNNYDWGGYLIYAGIPPFIDGRSDVYRDAFIREYVAAMETRSADALEKLVEKYKVTWTLLPPEASAVSMLDRTPGWRRLYADSIVVVHTKTSP